VGKQKLHRNLAYRLRRRGNQRLFYSYYRPGDDRALEVKMIAQENDLKNILRHKVTTMLKREELEFLDKLGKDSLFSTGHKLSYNEILKSLLDLAMESGINGENISSSCGLKEKIKQKLKI
jgi:hypothetical protein